MTIQSGSSGGAVKKLWTCVIITHEQSCSNDCEKPLKLKSQLILDKRRASLEIFRSPPVQVLFLLFQSWPWEETGLAGALMLVCFDLLYIRKWMTGLPPSPSPPLCQGREYKIDGMRDDDDEVSSCADNIAEQTQNSKIACDVVAVLYTLCLPIAIHLQRLFPA